MANTYLTRTYGSGGNRKKWTMSMWVKRSKILSGDDNMLFQSYVSTYTYCPFDSNDRLRFQDGSGGNKITTMKFRDTNAWYHIVVAIDTDLSTAGDRYKIYVNGNRITAFDTDSNPSQGYEGEWNKASQVHNIGRHGGGSGYFDGLMSHIHFCDGYQYQASDFGETDSTTGEWKIKTSPSVSYGTTGFFILKDGNSVTDQSGNSNNWTANGTLTKSEDCPSNVFATLNPLTRSGAAVTLQKGNTSKVGSSTNSWRSIVSTLGVSTGKYYFEAKMDGINSSDPNNFAIGITDYEQTDDQSSTNGKFFAFSRGYGYYAGNGKKVNNDQNVDNGVAYGSTYTTGDIIGCAFDLDNGKIYFSKNGTWQNSGDPTSGSTGTGSAFNITTGYTYFPVMAQYYSAEQYSFNFGNGYFGTTAVSSAGTNASGNGVFEYDVPTGYTALSTKGLNE